MARKKTLDASEYIKPLYMNGLQGRMLYLPASARKKRDILLVYGLHASLERLFGVAEDLNKYGRVTMPDLPGFGGMESFYKIGEKPTLDSLADYLAAFVKMRYKRKKVTIVAISFGFLVVTKMLQKYPELAKKVDMLVSIVGFVHRSDFKFKKRDYLMLRWSASFLSHRPLAFFFRHVLLRKTFITWAYQLVADRPSKLKDADEAERKKRINFEITLWQCNDVRTYMDAIVAMLTVDLCDKRIDLPVYNIEVADDRYLDNRIVEQHLNVVYSDVHIYKSKLLAHAPSIVADAKAAAAYVPRKIRRVLARPA